jgi:hypothetical protein
MACVQGLLSRLRDEGVVAKGAMQQHSLWLTGFRRQLAAAAGHQCGAEHRPSVPPTPGNLPPGPAAALLSAAAHGPLTVDVGGQQLVISVVQQPRA